MIAPVSRQIVLASLAGALGAQEPAGPVAILEHADVRIAIEGRRASVEAAYHLDRAAGLLLLDAMRIPGQTLEIEEEAGPATVLRRLDDVVGLHRVAARTGLNRPAEESGPVELHLRYRVESVEGGEGGEGGEGDLLRIPIFVPAAPAIPRESTIRITLSGIAASAVARDAFPRFEVRADGSLVATPTNLPSVVVLTRSDQRLTVNRAAELTVVFLILLSSVYWGTRVRPRRRSAKGQGGQGG